MKTTLRVSICGLLLCVLLVGVAGAQKMPDVVGIRLGMPAREAYAALQTAYPKIKLDTDPLRLPTIEKPILNGFSLGFSSIAAPDERISVNVTPPPEPQVVWRVLRYLSHQKIFRANVLASLREKYGKETAVFAAGLPASDATSTELWWIFDEQWRPGRLATGLGAYSNMVNCRDTFNAGGPGGSWFAPNNIMPKEDSIQDSGWCNTSMIAVIASFPPGEIILSLDVQMIHLPLALRSARAEIAWLKDISKRQQQQQIDQSKQAKPKL